MYNAFFWFGVVCAVWFTLLGLKFIFFKKVNVVEPNWYPPCPAFRKWKEDEELPFTD